MSDAERTLMRVALPVDRDPVAIIAGYLGLFAVLGVFAPLALLTGIWGVVRLSKRPDRLGRGRAWFGLIMGAIFSVLAGLIAYSAAVGG